MGDELVKCQCSCGKILEISRKPWECGSWHIPCNCGKKLKVRVLVDQMEKTCRDLRRGLESLREAFNSCSDPFDVVEIGCKIERIEKELEKEEKIKTDKE